MASGNERPRPLLTFNDLPTSTIPMNPMSANLDDDGPVRRWYHSALLYVTILLIVAPHPSLLYFLAIHYLKTLKDPFYFALHLSVTYTLTFLALSSLIVCVARDPGPVSVEESNGDDDGEVGLSEALLGMDDDFNSPAKWCRKCWAPKPERTHHCSMCGRCVLKMDHHCPWLGSKCVGHRTYPAFLHFLSCVTLFAIYVTAICARFIHYAFTHPFDVEENIPYHTIGLFFAGCIIVIVIGSFLVYHLYLVTTNQTTVEHISPFLLLRYLPPLPRTGHKLSDPPQEHELSSSQRRLVKDAHGTIRLYDVGWKKNWAQVFGWKSRYGWLRRLLNGGARQMFTRNFRSEELLERLARELVEADKDN
ncbi:zf-DHHC-domain-containing protein [Marasmius fiardii PR-910]|nr:zf-DHHC-domain-containing protein [Marasmius fiardii PR-910]